MFTVSEKCRCGGTAKGSNYQYVAVKLDVVTPGRLLIDTSKIKITRIDSAVTQLLAPPEEDIVMSRGYLKIWEAMS